jgi:SIT4 phosphatase-associated protein.
MYRVVKNDTYNSIIKQIRENYNDGNERYLDSLGHNHVIYSFEISENEKRELLYENKTTGETYKLNLYIAKLQMSLELKKGNRVFDFLTYKNWYSDKVKYSSDPAFSEGDKKINAKFKIFGIKIGDLFRSFIKNKTKVDKEEFENGKILKMIEKAKPLDDSQGEILGVFCVRQERLYIWSDLHNQKLVKNTQSNFGDFCNKIIYISAFSFNNEDSKIDDNMVLNKLNNWTIIKKLIRYFLYNEDSDSVSINEIEYFDPPKPIPEILKLHIGKNEINLYLYQDMYNKITKKINSNQKAILKKYGSSIFQTAKHIPCEYPYYVLKNISLKEWHGDTDISYIGFIYNDYMARIKNNKLKYKSQKSKKKEPLIRRVKDRENNWDWDNVKKNISKKDMKNIIDDAYEEMECYDEYY